jgi:hypothetical protein
MENLTPAFAVDAPIEAIPNTATAAKMIFFIFTFRYFFGLFGHIFQTQTFDFYSMRLYQ